MKFTLKDYQEDAVKKVLDRLKTATRRWRDESEKNAFSLTAATGAGKTVMAAAVLEALFRGSDDFDFEPNKGAVVIWFSDDPALNEQSRFRLLEASNRLLEQDLCVVNNDFDQEKLEAGKIYFLNTQKLSRTSLLVRGHDSADSVGGKSDKRTFTIWHTIRETIEDPGLILYLVLDEAHRGMGTSNGNGQEEKPTIVRRLINGFDSIPGIPVVLGVSATVKRFNAAMADGEDRAILPNVTVDPEKVRASGLLKDIIILDAPNETGAYDTVLVRRGTKKLKKISRAWEEYARQQGETNEVSPLMVLQVPDKPDHAEIGRLLDAIRERWPELPEDAFANVFGEHTTEDFGGHSVPYVSPERVQESEDIRVLIAKDAISTGWDCPRAEVMVSFRPARDRTHIAQLLGRMVRTPLARRIEGNDRLNTVNCILPFFDPDSLHDVVDVLMRGGDGSEIPPGRNVYINSQELNPNPDIPQEVWDKLLSLPSQSLPRLQTKPVKRLRRLAHELAANELLANASEVAHSKMHKVLNSARELYGEQIEEARNRILKVEGKSVEANLKTGTLSPLDNFSEDADDLVIDDAYRRAKRIISPELANTYSEILAKSKSISGDPVERLVEAHVIVASLGLVPEVETYLNEKAGELTEKWLWDYRVAIKNLPDSRQEVFNQISEMSANPKGVDLVKPTSWIRPATILDADGKEAQRFDKHLLCADDGKFPEAFNEWEKKVFRTESERSNFVAWYRNPSRAGRDSLGIGYKDSEAHRIMRPDFIFFALRDGEIVANIIDPHSDQFRDAIPKLQGLARYAETNGGVFHRIETVTKINDSFRVLDLTKANVREAVYATSDLESLYKSKLANDYT